MERLLSSVGPYKQSAQIARHQSPNTTSLVLGIVGASILVAVVLFIIYYIIKCLQQERAAAEAEAVGAAAGAAPAEIEVIQRTLCVVESFPLQTFEEREGGGGDVCSICLESFAPGGNVWVLPVCNHIFHVECIGIAWEGTRLLRCPNCRHDYTSWPPV